MPIETFIPLGTPLVGNADADVIFGDADDNLILGGAGDDEIFANDGDDVILGGPGDDNVFGNDGNDVMIYQAGDGNDAFNGTGGIDRLIAAVETGPIFRFSGDEATALFEIVTFDLPGSVRLGNIDVIEVHTTDVNDVFEGADGGENSIDVSLEINAAGGFDQIQGGLADDTLRGEGGDDAIRGNEGDDRLEGGTGDDTLTGNRGDDAKLGGEGDDLLIWNNGDGSDLMEGGAGDDRVQVNAADGDGDIFQIDAVAGRVDFQRLNLGLFSLDIAGVETLEVNGQGGDDRILASEGVGDILALDLDGALGNDVLTGSNATDTLSGGAGDDVLTGAQGDDQIFGGDGIDLMIWNNGDGSDFMQGGAAVDTTQVNGADAAGDAFTISATIEGVLFKRTNLGLFQLDIQETESLDINAQGGDDTVSLDPGIETAITLDLDGGADRAGATAAFGLGDTIDLSALAVGVSVDLDTTFAGVAAPGLAQEGRVEDLDGTAFGFAVTDFENVIGTAFDDRIFGNAEANVLEGRGGDDVFHAFAGNDIYDGGEGADLALFNQAETALLADLDLGLVRAGTDRNRLISIENLNGGDFDDQIFGDAGVNQLSGRGGDDTLVGRQGDDSLFGGAGDDLIVWNNGDGSDVIEGGDEADIQRVNAADEAGDIFAVSANGDRTTVARTNLGLFSLDIGAVETIELNGQGGDDDVTVEGLGSAIARFEFDAGAGDDSFTVLPETDLSAFVLFRGGAGDDAFFGGGGAERAEGGAGDDVFTTGGGDDTVVDREGETTARTGAGDDRVTTGGGDDTVEAGAGADVVKTGGGDDTVEGGDGDDTVLSGDEDDALDGGAGDDVLKSGRGDDDVEGGAGDDFIDAFRGDDLLFGGEGADVLRGSLGDDTIDGGTGEDRIVAGPGRDTIVFSDGFGEDRVLDFTPGSDLLDFSGLSEPVDFAALDLQQIGTSTVIEGAFDGRVILADTEAAALTEDQFVF